MKQAPRFKPVRQTRVSEEVAEQLKQSILLGHFRAGDKLPPERDLAEEFQVSRVAIREALRALEKSGFMVTRQGPAGGAYATDLTFDNLMRAFLDLFMADKISLPELFKVRELVEPEVARLAALHINEKDAARLKEALKAEEIPAAILRDDIERKTRIHLLLAEICGNRFFEALVRSVVGLTTRVIEAVQPEPPFLHPAGMHRPIVKAVLSGDAGAAATAMAKHAVQFGQTLMQMEEKYRKNSKERRPVPSVSVF